MNEIAFPNIDQVSPGSTMSITVDDQESVMTISLHHSYVSETIEIILLVIVSLFMVWSNSIFGCWYAFPLLFLLGIVDQIYRKRIVRCIIKKRENINYFRSGLLGSRFDEKKLVFLISNIDRFELKRYKNWGRRNQFQINVVLSNDEKIDLSGRMLLNISDCRTKVDIFRKFTNPKLSISEIDDP